MKNLGKFLFFSTLLVTTTFADGNGPSNVQVRCTISGELATATNASRAIYLRREKPNFAFESGRASIKFSLGSSTVTDPAKKTRSTVPNVNVRIDDGQREDIFSISLPTAHGVRYFSIGNTSNPAGFECRVTDHSEQAVKTSDLHYNR